MRQYVADRVFSAVIFDLDGVIADSHPIHEIAWRRLLEEQARGYPPEFVSSVIREGKTRPEILQTFFPDVPVEKARALGERKDALYYENIERCAPIPGVLSWIERLRQLSIPTAVATSASRTRALRTLQAFGIESSFRAVVTASEVPLGKPDPALFLAAAVALPVAPECALVVEDSLAGLQAGRSAGMSLLLYSPSRDPQLFALSPDFVVDTFNEISLEPVMKRFAR